MASSAIFDTRPREIPRPPPNPHSGSLLSSELFTDQSEYLGLGDAAGSVVAVGDFTTDRYVDLLVVPHTKLMRSLQVLAWNHHKYSFSRVACPSNSTFRSILNLNSIPGASSEARIVSAAPFDANSDGFLDVLVNVLLPDDSHVGLILRGDGSGCLRFDRVLPGLTPNMLIMDANDDMHSDIFFVSDQSERVFYINGPPGRFTKMIWKPGPLHNHCIPTTALNSNAFVDIDGDCEPDFVVSTSCGLEVWFNHGLHDKSSSRWVYGQQYFTKDPHNFTNTSKAVDTFKVMILNESVWDPSHGDGQATFGDFNADGAIDIAVANRFTSEVRISYNVRRPYYEKKLCAVDPSWHFETHVALEDVHVSDTLFGPMRLQSRIRSGDFNYDGKLDLLLIDGDSGTLSLYAGASTDSSGMWYPRPDKFLERVLFPLTGRLGREHEPKASRLHFSRFNENPILYNLEDPIAATFIDLDESGRQDLLISQRHGTRLIWNSYQEKEDAVYFKATGVNAAHKGWKSKKEGVQAFSPLPGNTFKVSYGGRFGRETHTCTQCPQTSVLSLQPCSCLFGITRIANYIEEMAMGGSGGVRTWTSLMPNALAVIWPQGRRAQGGIRWKVSYLSRGRDGQMKRIVFVLCATLVLLFFAILYIHTVEGREEKSGKFDFGYT
ncbi:hypothetical protein FGB62_4g465 [Gracilaria domingensis]|nr:hypothetical protein FGB62_4g465 [Gracilaria domingensis]